MNVTELMNAAIQVYVDLYPDRNQPSIQINCSQPHGLRNVMPDTGMCYPVAKAVEATLLRLGQACQVFLTWQDYDGETELPYEDTFAHAGVVVDGRYYDTLQPDGVDDPDDLYFMRKGLARLVTIQHDGDSRFGDFSDSPYIKKLVEYYNGLSTN